MMRERLFKTIFIFFFSFPFILAAQVEAPSLSCISGDSLYWEIPNNNCGPFNAYLIYASQNEAGPYTLLTTITNPAQVSYHHEDPGVSTWYYYMESDNDCPGETILQSDTLDNRMPESPVFEFVSVDGTDVVINWSPSPSPEVIGYIISRNITGQGTTAIDTVFVGNTYTDVSANPDQLSEVYFLEALDACGNRSLISNPHNTILLDASTPSVCDRSINLNWNAYDGWLSGVEEQEIWVSKNGMAAVPVATISGSATSYDYEEIDDQANYCFTIRAKANGQEWYSRSSEICVFADVIQRQSYLIAANATVDNNGNVLFSWLWNDNAELISYSIQRSTDNTSFTAIEQLNTPFSQMPQEAYQDVNVNPELGPLYYQVASVDECDETVSSNIVSTIFLQAAREGNNVNLNWSPYINELANVESYTLYRISDAGTALINTFDANTFSTTDFLSTGELEQLQVCYYIEAAASIEVPDGTILSVESRSAEACVSQDAGVYIPNAFSPNGDGRNDEFRPYLQFGAPTDYQLQVFDRWGGLRFESSDINQGWDGTTKGKNAPIGLYLYYLHLEQGNGTIIERSGEISLLR